MRFGVVLIYINIFAAKKMWAIISFFSMNRFGMGDLFMCEACGRRRSVVRRMVIR